MRALRKGDVLVVWKLDRLGRNLAHLVHTVQDPSRRGVGLRVLTGQGAQIDTATAASRLVFGIFAALAEFDRELIREARAGLKAALAYGWLAQATMAQRDTPCPNSALNSGSTRDALQVRRAPRPVARAGRGGPRHLNRSASTAPPRGHEPKERRLEPDKSASHAGSR